MPPVFFTKSTPRLVLNRLYVIWRLPKLVTLDATQVSDSERAEAVEKGQYLGVAKPNPKQVAVCYGI